MVQVPLEAVARRSWAAESRGEAHVDQTCPGCGAQYVDIQSHYSRAPDCEPPVAPRPLRAVGPGARCAAADQTCPLSDQTCQGCGAQYVDMQSHYTIPAPQNVSLQSLQDRSGVASSAPSRNDRSTCSF